MKLIAITFLPSFIIFVQIYQLEEADLAPSVYPLKAFKLHFHWSSFLFIGRIKALIAMLKTFIEQARRQYNVLTYKHIEHKIVVALYIVSCLHLCIL